MNFSTVPPKRSSSLADALVVRGEKRAHVLGVQSAPRCAVEPTRSQKRTVTTFRSSRAAVASCVSDPPHPPQYWKPSGFSCPQLGHVIIREAYAATCP